MCATCGCAGDGAVVHGAAGGHDHGHDHAHDHAHVVPHGDARTVQLQQKVLAKNDGIAAGTRAWLAKRGVGMLNLMSSPGAGKTTLLEGTARALAGTLDIAVIEGDQETALDASRISAAGCRVVQINTGSGCHLDAAMVARGLDELGPAPGSAVVIENVGNLVCPALFDLGEAHRVVLAAVTEGPDKPMKYPQMFRQADLVLLTKVDLLPYVEFDTGRYAADLARVNPSAGVIQLSATTGEGMGTWLTWLTAAARCEPRPLPPGRG
ncbi:MAG TPA: hydrogenase nickel incorporation protein HypB [Streptosporangiaceae bacterium]|nr:hydrogenase nickel incorporation protein HypB [Streptosporangiaceae bacterium]